MSRRTMPPNKKMRCSPDAAMETGNDNISDGEHDEEDPSVSARVLKMLKEGKTTSCVVCNCKPLKNGTNWDSTTNDVRGQLQPQGPLCSRCGDFLKDSAIPLQELLTMKDKGAAKAKKIRSDVETHTASKANPEGREFPLENVFMEERTTSLLIEKFEWQEKGTFEAKHDGHSPSDLGLTLLKEH